MALSMRVSTLNVSSHRSYLIDTSTTFRFSDWPLCSRSILIRTRLVSPLTRSLRSVGGARTFSIVTPTRCSCRKGVNSAAMAPTGASIRISITYPFSFTDMFGCSSIARAVDVAANHIQIDEAEGPRFQPDARFHPDLEPVVGDHGDPGADIPSTALN